MPERCGVFNDGFAFINELMVFVSCRCAGLCIAGALFTAAAF